MWKEKKRRKIELNGRRENDEEERDENEMFLNYIQNMST